MFSLISSTKCQLYSLLHLQITGHCQNPKWMDMRGILLRVIMSKVAWPDIIPCNVLKKCANQLAEVMTDICRISLSQETIPTCSKTAIIIPAPKNSAVSSQNNYCPVALAPILLKCFEKLALQHIKDNIPASLDHHQHAFRTNRSTEDLIFTALHSVFMHMEEKTAISKFLTSALYSTQSHP